MNQTKVLGAFCLFLALSSCATKEKFSTINLSVKDKTTKPVRVCVNEIDTLMQLNDEGNASIQLSLKKPQFGIVQYKWKTGQVYFEPGKDVNVEWDMTPAELTIDFTGKYSEKNINLNSKEYRSPIMRDLGLAEEELLKQLNEYAVENNKILDKKKFDKDFKNKQRINLEYFVYGILWQYAQRGGCTDLTYDKLKSLMREDDWLLDLNLYRNFMQGAVNVIANKDVVPDALPNVKTENEINYVINNLHNQKIKDYLIASSAIGYLANKGLKGSEKIQALFKANVKDADAIKAFNEVCNAGAQLSKGKISPDFNMEDINGKVVTLADFKGKYIYIDVWATWCVPCQQELPALQELEGMFMGTNLAFVSMSIDKDKERWSKEVKDKKLGGVQLYAGANSEFAREYNITAIPRFILIDPEGNIVDSNMTRPSDKKTAHKLSLLVSEAQ